LKALQLLMKAANSCYVLKACMRNQEPRSLLQHPGYTPAADQFLWMVTVLFAIAPYNYKILQNQRKRRLQSERARRTGTS